MSIGSRIYQRRKMLEMTQPELAEKVGVSFQAVSSWERDEYLPDLENLLGIVKALSTKASFLLGEDNAVIPNWELRDRVFSEEHMYTFVKATATAKALTGTFKALPFAREKHDGYLRKGKDHVPYINHPLTMACHALAMDIVDDDILAAILLHDVVEDCRVLLDELPASDRVKDIVDRVSKAELPDEDRHAFKTRYHDRIMERPAASLVKVIDRCNNLSMMATGFEREKMISYIVETERYVFPVIDRLKETSPEYSNAVFLLKYQMISVMESLKRMLVK
jgi:(p)ppGpp synthase/HD superfamily hydrolase